MDIDLIVLFITFSQGGGDVGESEDDEDQLVKMMQGMMSSLLSRDVLYPSLMELCKQV